MYRDKSSMRYSLVRTALDKVIEVLLEHWGITICLIFISLCSPHAFVKKNIICRRSKSYAGDDTGTGYGVRR